jgi:hypothetical protein
MEEIMNPRRITLTVGAAAGGLLLAAVLPMAAAHADEFVYTPNDFYPDSTTEWGIQGLFGGATGTGLWNTEDFTSQPPGDFGDSMGGTVTHTQIGLFTNDFFTLTGDKADPGYLGLGSTIDYANYGLGFGNELVDATPGSDFASGIYDTMITPFGDFLLF